MKELDQKHLKKLKVQFKLLLVLKSIGAASQKQVDDIKDEISKTEIQIENQISIYDELD